jgi:hypothetical protein
LILVSWATYLRFYRKPPQGFARERHNDSKALDLSDA